MLRKVQYIVYVNSSQWCAYIGSSMNIGPILNQKAGHYHRTLLYSQMQRSPTILFISAQK